MKKVAWALSACLASCGQAGEVEHSRLAQDSAGVAIVVDSPPYAQWSLDSAGAMRIGVVDGSPEYQFSNIMHAARLSDGGTVVVDGGSLEVRWFDHLGDLMALAGGRGEGPGELLGVSAATLASGDTLVVYDAWNQRLTLFSRHGGFVSARRLELEPGSRVGVYGLDGGRFLVTEEQLALNLGGREYNAARDSMLVLLTTAAAASVDTVMRVSGRQALTWVDYVNGTPTATRQMELPLGELTLAGGVGDRITVVQSGRHDLRWFDERGTLVAISRRQDVKSAPVSSEVRREYVAGQVASAAARGGPIGLIERGAELRLELVPEGQTVPAFGRLLIDVVGEAVWLQDYEPEWRAAQEQTWTVYDRSGRVSGQLRTPAGTAITQVTSSHVVGVERDAFGVEYAVTYPVRR